MAPDPLQRPNWTGSRGLLVKVHGGFLFEGFGFCHIEIAVEQ